MKKGDLVMIRHECHREEEYLPVTVGSISPEKNHRQFPPGAVALFLGDNIKASADGGLPESKLILIDSEIGWVWHDEIEMYSHSAGCYLVVNLPSEGNPV